MPESFEKHFAQKKETLRPFGNAQGKQAQGKEKSPEEIKEEKGLKLAEEIKEIKQKMGKEGKTVEGYEKIIELTQKIKEIYEEKERNYETEVKTIVANLEKALAEGASKDDVARSLAGVGTKEAMELRERLIKEGADKDYVVRSLAGVGTKESMAFRERLIKEGASKDYVAWGLAGVGTEQAMELRERLIKEGTYKDYVARSLAGVNTKEAEEFRRKHFGDNSNLIARSYSTDWTIYDGVICCYGYEK